MSLTIGMVEELVALCAGSEALAGVRAKALSQFLGYDEPGTVEHLPGAGNVSAPERRFLGWFCFSFRLPDGRRPAELAASALLAGPQLASTLKSIQEARYITAVATRVRPGKGVHLQLQDEGLEVNSRMLSQALCRDDVLCAHIIPDGQASWLVLPGWIVWPTRFGPDIQSRLRTSQLDPIQVERLFQRRPRCREEGKTKRKCSRDHNLEEAVGRMTEAARSEGKDELVRPVEE